MKVKILKRFVDKYSRKHIDKGVKCTYKDDRANELIKLGYAERIEEQLTTKEDKTIIDKK